MIRSDIRDEVRLRAGLGAADPIFDDATLDTLINSSLRRISVLGNWPWLEYSTTVNTVAGTQTVTLTTHRKIDWMRIDNQRLSYVNHKALADFDGKTGRPHAYTEFGGVVSLVPTPDAVYTITFGITLAADPPLTTDGAEPRIDDWAIDMLIADVCMLVAKRERNREREAVFYAERERFRSSILDDTPRGNEPALPDRPLWRDQL